MLEYPESHVLAKQIEAALKGKTVRTVLAAHSPHKFAWFSGDPADYPKKLEGKTILSSRATGGLVEILLEDVLLVFGDGTNLRFFPAGETLPEKHQLLLVFTDGSALAASVQMYGGLWALSEGETVPFHEAGKKKPDPLSEAFDLPHFRSLDTEGGKISLKGYLATGQRIPGLGNGVLQDILFQARLHPKRKTGRMSDPEWETLFRSVKETLSVMTASGGRDTEKDLFGNPGGYRTLLSSKTLDSPCPSCGGSLVREAYLGGNIYFCPVCQKNDK